MKKLLIGATLLISMQASAIELNATDKDNLEKSITYLSKPSVQCFSLARSPLDFICTEDETAIRVTKELVDMFDKKEKLHQISKKLIGKGVNITEKDQKIMHQFKGFENNGTLLGIKIRESEHYNEPKIEGCEYFFVNSKYTQNGAIKFKSGSECGNENRYYQYKIKSNLIEKFGLN
ncbi:hypothetical protein AB4232_21590 [Vibrio sp. 10N.286.46.A8]|uniref:hypothetical protein n=1 Tax=Vibrio sp. 10N.286.46.A8 TaxID=3229697 RepID=UPI0035538B5B